jgi:hypothetical protein
MRSLVLLLSTVVLLVSGCSGGSDGSSEQKNSVAYLMDAPVEGVSYHCNGINGTTGQDGSFEYEAGCIIAFKIGSVELGGIPASSINADGLVFIPELFALSREEISDLRVVNLLQFLQSLDEDDNVSNGIEITPSRQSELSESDLDLRDGTTSASDINATLSAIGEELVDAGTAVAHYVDTLETELGITFNTPILIDLTATVNENAAEGSVVGKIAVADAGDAPISTITLSGDGAEDFDAAADGTITVINALDYERQNFYDLNAVAVNASGESAPGDVNITIVNVPEAVPVLSSTSIEVAENTAAGTQIGTVTIADPGDSAITAITLSGTDASHFSASEDGTIAVAIPPDYETQPSYTLSAVATNAAGASVPVEVSITVTDVADTAPELAPFGTTVPDGTEVGTVVGTITVIDPGDGTITSITLSGDGENDFSVANDGTITVANPLDSSSQPTYSLSAVATNGVGTSDPVNVTIFVTDGSFQVLELNELEADTPRTEDDFGYDVAINGIYAVVGARLADVGGVNDVGAAYVYKKDADGHYIRIAELTSDDGVEGDYFGNSVAIDGDYVVVGAMGEDNEDANASFDCGALYVFKKDASDNYTQIAKLVANDGEYYDHLGWVVDISGDYIVTGADNAMNLAGSAYVFKNDGSDNYTQVQKLTASDATTADYFGYSVAISGEYIAVGAFYEHALDINNAGSAYIFKKDAGVDTFSEVAKLHAEDAQDGDLFGRSIDIDGSYVVVGAWYEDPIGVENAGSAYVFTNDGNDVFNQVAKLTSGVLEVDGQFGVSVAIDGEYVVVGADHEDFNGMGNAGSAYLFRNDGADNFYQTARINASDAAGGDYFGKAVGISGNDIAVGANSADPTSNPDAGSAFAFQIAP